MKSNLARRLKQLPLTEGERALALAHLQRGEAIADAILAVSRAFRGLLRPLDCSQARRAAG